jgi:hypothetical protein
VLSLAKSSKLNEEEQAQAEARVTTAAQRATEFERRSKTVDEEGPMMRLRGTSTAAISRAKSMQRGEDRNARNGKNEAKWREEEEEAMR